MISEIYVFTFAFLISVVGVGMALLYTRKTGLVDVPNHRSSHTVPTPRGGGLAVVASVLGLALYYGLDTYVDKLYVLLGIVVILLTIIGWFDDRGGMPVSLRLTVHLGAGIVIAALVNRIAPMAGLANLVWLIWWLFWTVASINIVNFMDGIDGMVGSQGVIYGLFLFLLLPSNLLASQFGLILAAACMGFLLWNWAPAKIFMGDVGSGPLGLFFVIGGALALKGATASLVFLPLYPLFLDALVTVVRRFKRKERLTQAHRSHLYQRIANRGYGHAIVSFSYAVAAAVGALLAILMKNASPLYVILTIVLYVVSVTWIWKIVDAKFRVE